MGVSFSRRKNKVKAVEVAKSLETSLKIPVPEENSPNQADAREKEEKYKSALTPIGKGAKRSAWKKKRDGKKKGISKKMTLAEDHSLSKSLSLSGTDQRSLDEELEEEIMQSLENLKQKLASSADFKANQFLKDYSVLLDFVRSQEIGRWRKFEDIGSLPNCLILRLDDCYGESVKVVILAERDLQAHNQKMLELMKLQSLQQPDSPITKVRNFSLKHNKKSGFYYLIMTSEYAPHNMKLELGRLKPSGQRISSENVRKLLKILLEYALVLRRNQIHLPSLQVENIGVFIDPKTASVQFKISACDALLLKSFTPNSPPVLTTIGRIALSLLTPSLPSDPEDQKWDGLAEMAADTIMKTKTLPSALRRVLIKLVNSEKYIIREQSLIKSLTSPLDNDPNPYQDSSLPFSQFSPMSTGQEKFYFYLAPASPILYFYRPFSSKRPLVCIGLNLPNYLIYKILGLYRDEKHHLHVTFAARAKDGEAGEFFHSVVHTEFLLIKDRELDKLEEFFVQINYEKDGASNAGARRLLVQNLINEEGLIPAAYVEDLVPFVWDTTEKAAFTKRFPFLQVEEQIEINKNKLTKRALEFISAFIFTRDRPITLDLEPLGRFEKDQIPISVFKRSEDIFFQAVSEKSGKCSTWQRGDGQFELQKLNEGGSPPSSKGHMSIPFRLGFFFRSHAEYLFWVSSSGRRIIVQGLDPKSGKWATVTAPPTGKRPILDEGDFILPVRAGASDLFVLFGQAKLELIGLTKEGRTVSRFLRAADSKEYNFFKSLINETNGLVELVLSERNRMQMFIFEERGLFFDITLEEDSRFGVNIMPLNFDSALESRKSRSLKEGSIARYEIRDATCTVFESKIVEAFCSTKKEGFYVIRKRLLDRRSEDFEDLMRSAQEIMTMKGKYLKPPADFFVAVSPPSNVELNFVYDRLDSNLLSLMNIRKTNHKGELLPIHNLLDFLSQIAHELFLLEQKKFYCYEINPMIIFVETQKNMPNKLFYRLIHFEKASKFFGKNPFIDYRKELHMNPPVQEDSDNYFCFDIHKSNIYSLAITALQYATQTDVTKLNTMAMHDSLLAVVDDLSYPPFLKQVFREMLHLDESLRPDALSLLLKLKEIKRNFTRLIYFREAPESIVRWRSNWSYNAVKNDIILYNYEKNFVSKIHLPAEIAFDSATDSICFDNSKKFYVFCRGIEGISFFELSSEDAAYQSKMLPSPPFKLVYGAKMFYFNYRIYCFGGFLHSQNGLLYQTKSFYFSLKRQVWCAIERVPVLSPKSCIYEVDGHIYALNDRRNSLAPDADGGFLFLDVYSVNFNQWKSIPIINKLKCYDGKSLIVLPMSKYSCFIWGFGSRDMLLVNIALSRSKLLKIEIEETSDKLGTVFNSTRRGQALAVSGEGETTKLLVATHEGLDFVEFRWNPETFLITGKCTKIM